MANWASTSYVIEGNPETLEKIHDAILHHKVQEGSNSNWEGNVLIALGIDKELLADRANGYIRGFIQGDSWFDGNTLKFDAEEAWGVTDFDDYLAELFDDIRIYWISEEPGMRIYQTNDADGKYFPDRFYVDTCIDGEYESEYFKTKQAAYDWLAEITDGRVSSEEDAESFNADYEDSDASDENYIYVHEFEIV